jgi:hypothetical protein
MNRYQVMTLAFILATAAVFAASWIIYDVWAIATPERRAADATISRVMLLMARKSPLWVAGWTALLVGLIVHFWGSQDTCAAEPDDHLDPPGPA